ncbi:hypothetical protein HGP16_28595 [Rhizobium sp. P40RR-XXII]|uniref:hypothetical protein n=1 Tax=Rhizobium sp. P40RR-XXII TaxID=2726739 RepID=UPI0014564472|nr:hypothetical protein [Rhizobium sp. P40RR-XXII]NLS20484.1 hypothetical protein [Rhizobium sp. P40RR-XXII]
MTVTRGTFLATGGISMIGSVNAGASNFKVLFQGNVFADYFQIYLRDEGHPDLPDDYTDHTIARRLAAGPYAIILHTVQYDRAGSR